MMENMDTAHYELRLTQCESRAEYEALVREHQSLYVGWEEHMKLLRVQKRLKYADVVRGCDVSDGTARSWFKKIPAKREYVIMLAMIMGLTVDETDELLTRWAKYQKLYARNPSDAIWIFLLRKGGSDQPRELFRRYYDAYEMVRKEYKQRKKTGADLPLPMETQIFMDEILEKADQTGDQIPEDVDPEFLELMRSGMPSFENGYRKLLDYIDGFFYDLEKEDRRRLGLDIPVSSKKTTPNMVFQSDDTWKEAYYRKMRALEKRQVMPGRAFLIALGLRLCMNTDQINHLLDLAGMGSLCPKDLLEGTMVFYLEGLSCNYPSYFNLSEGLNLGGEYDLMDYTAPGKKASMAVQGVELPDIAVDFEDNPVECLNDYIKRSVLGTDVFEFGYDDYVMELLHML